MVLGNTFLTIKKGRGLFISVLIYVKPNFECEKTIKPRIASPGVVPLHGNFKEWAYNLFLTWEIGLIPK